MSEPTTAVGLSVLNSVPHSHPDGFPCLACGRDAARTAVAAERARLRVVFKRYGAHDHDCPAEMPSPFTGKDQGCWCGLVETWAAFPERPPSCPDHPEDY